MRSKSQYLIQINSIFNCRTWFTVPPVPLHIQLTINSSNLASSTGHLSFHFNSFWLSATSSSSTIRDSNSTLLVGVVRRIKNPFRCSSYDFDLSQLPWPFRLNTWHKHKRQLHMLPSNCLMNFSSIIKQYALFYHPQLCPISLATPAPHFISFDSFYLPPVYPQYSNITHYVITFILIISRFSLPAFDSPGISRSGGDGVVVSCSHAPMPAVPIISIPFQPTESEFCWTDHITFISMQHISVQFDRKIQYNSIRIIQFVFNSMKFAFQQGSFHSILVDFLSVHFSRQISLKISPRQIIQYKLIVVITWK